MKKTTRTFTAEMLREVIEYIRARITEITETEDVPRVKIVGGNTKLGTIPAFNLPPLVTCRNCAACSKHCYAVKDYLNYRVKAVSTNHARNYAALQNNIMLAQRDIERYLDRHQPPFFRIHSSGDFDVTIDGNPYAYALMWYGIAKRHPETRFLAFTKHYDVAREINFDRLANFSLVLSEWTDVLTAPADLKDRYHTSRALVNLSDARPDEIICPGNCTTCGACWALDEIGKNVAFEIH